MDETNLRQVADQCRAVAHMATVIADVHSDLAKLFAAGGGAPADIAGSVGERTARLMEYLGDVLNGMDAVSEEDEWTAPIFAEAHRLWPAKETDNG